MFAKELAFFHLLLQKAQTTTVQQMQYLVKNGKLELKYQPGKGAWTYHLRIPNTAAIEGKWGDIKVSGFIDNFKLEARNLAPIKGEDKMLSELSDDVINN